MADFLNIDQSARVYTSARDRGDGKPVTDVSLTGSYKGYSNEAKPVINNPVEGVMYSYLELDTKGIYILHGGQWVRFV